ncbi:hypothetical protein [Acinetobacter haemolyticus]|uniref:hypothetical protein n=1 Tax=Acinetobacter haemolyticus TaxID=29430 RepID=UPI000AB79FF1|nr:hypothetical protein [Acinetobacter haemolyticus]WHR58904.1 hypothetical protein PGW89_05565 [Acinetobacter haemolyticus]
MSLENVTWQFITFVIGLTLGGFFSKYFAKKGENLATKEDITEITSKIETVKHEYASQLESVKAELSAKLTTYGFRYEKEYEVLSELTAVLVELRDASTSLRPVFDFHDPNMTKDEIKQERLKRFFDSRKNLYLIRERKRPFYPDDIYQAILSIENIAHKESIGYQYKDPFEKGSFLAYWEEAEKNQKEITASVENALMKVRDRVTTWEVLYNY